MIPFGVKDLTKSEKNRERLGADKARANNFSKSKITSILFKNGFTMADKKSGRNASHFFFKHPLLLKHSDLLKKHPYWFKHIGPGGKIQIIFHGEIAYGTEAAKIDKVLDLLEKLEDIENTKK